MAKRRPSGDGMVRKREDGRWEGRIVVGHKKNGTPIFQHAYTQTVVLVVLNGEAYVEGNHIFLHCSSTSA